MSTVINNIQQFTKIDFPVKYIVAASAFAIVAVALAAIGSTQLLGHAPLNPLRLSTLVGSPLFFVISIGVGCFAIYLARKHSKEEVLLNYLLSDYQTHVVVKIENCDLKETFAIEELQHIISVKPNAIINVWMWYFHKNYYGDLFHQYKLTMEVLDSPNYDTTLALDELFKFFQKEQKNPLAVSTTDAFLKHFIASLKDGYTEKHHQWALKFSKALRKLENHASLYQNFVDNMTKYSSTKFSDEDKLRFLAALCQQASNG